MSGQCRARKAMDLELFKEIIKEKCGLVFEDVRTETLEGGIRTRMVDCGLNSWQDYLGRLVKNETEFTNLVNLLTINETYFFREPAHIDLLANRLFPEMLASKKAGEPVRILSAGCSTGEEPYSIMMALIEKYGQGIRNSVSIIGADIDSNVVARAGQGVYNAFSFRNFPEPLLDRYFEAGRNGQYRIKRVVREAVQFQSLNLMTEVYPQWLRGVDVLFYRNVSIYFDITTQKRVFGKLAELLNDTGYLFVSSTETLSHDHGVLSLIEVDGVFCYRRGFELAVAERRTGAREQQKPIPGGPGTKRAALPAVRRPAVSQWKQAVPDGRYQPLDAPTGANSGLPRTPSPQFDEALELAKTKNYAEALKRIDEIDQNHSSFVKASMLKAGILINMKRVEDAELVCLKCISRSRWYLEGYLLLGLIAKMRDDDEGALRRFKEAMYIDTSCWLAHFYTAEIYSMRNDWKNACREYEIVVRLLQKGTIADHGLTFFPLAFPAEQIMHLCRHNLSKIKAGKA